MTAKNGSPKNIELGVDNFGASGIVLIGIICLNCDSQTDTFMSKNIGNGRATRGLEGFKSRKQKD